MIPLFKKTISRKKTLVILFLIFFLGCVLRFYRLGDIPVGFHRDEAFLGYNAYSILKTGRDISGNFLPLHFQSFIYSPAGYAYFAIPFIKIFDLSAFSIRFASAFFGSLTILLTYFLSKRLLGNLKFSDHIALISSFLLAISPWHINLSRTATENVLVVFFIALGVLLYLFWIKNGRWYVLAASYLFWAIAFLTYQAPRSFLPLLIPLITFLFLKPFKDKRKFWSTSILYFLIIIIPLLITLISPQLSLRIRTVSIFGTQETQLTLEEQLREDGVSGVNTFTARVFHNKLAGYFSQFTQNYFKHFSYEFLFTDQGLPIRYRVPGMGILYIFELPLLFLGSWFLLKTNKRVGALLIGWILLVPVGSGLTFDDIPNLQRTLIIFPALSIISGSGFYASLKYLRKLGRFFYPFLALIFLIGLYNLFFYLHQYYVHQVRHRPWYRHEGYKELVQKVNTLLPNYQKAVITNSESAPTIFFLFFGKYDPAVFQSEIAGISNRSDLDRISFHKYEFSLEQCSIREVTEKDNLTGKVKKVILGEKGILYVNQGICKPVSGADELVVVKRSDETEAFRVLSLPEK